MLVPVFLGVLNYTHSGSLRFNWRGAVGASASGQKHKMRRGLGVN